MLETGGFLIASQVLMAASGILSARALGPDGKGLVAGVLAWPVVLSWAGLLGVNTSLSVRVAADHDGNLRNALGHALTLALGSGCAVAAVGIAVIPSTLSHLGPHAEILSVAALATIPVAMLADVVMSLNIALGRIRLANASRLAGPLLILAATAVLVAFGRLTTVGFVAVVLSGSAVTLLSSSVGLPWRRLTVSLGELARDLRFGIKLHVGALLAFANVRLDVLLMSTLVGASQLGYYSVANNVMFPVSSLAAAAGALLTPAVARRAAAHRGAGAQQLALVRQEARVYFGAALLGGAALAAATPFALPAVLGRSFHPAVVLVWVLIPGYVARTYASVLTAGTAGMRRAWVGNVAEGAGLLLTVALLPLLLPRYGAMGAAITSTAAYTASAVAARLGLVRLGRQVGLRAEATDRGGLATPTPSEA